MTPRRLVLAHLLIAALLGGSLYDIATPVMVLAGIGMILGIRALMGPTFENFLLINLFWVPWDRVEAWVRARAELRAVAAPALAAAAPVSAGAASSKQHVAEIR